MSQNDMVIANQTFPATRADLNSAFQALASQSSGASAPPTVYPYQRFADTTNDVLKQYDDAATSARIVGSLEIDVVMSKSATYTIRRSDFGKTILANAAGAAFTLTLPDLGSDDVGYWVIIKKSDSSSNAATIDGDGSDTIDGAANVALSAQYDGGMFVWSGSAWYIIGRYYSPAAKGDILAAISAGVFSRLTVGANGQILTPDSAQSAGLSWVDRSDGFRNRIINGDMRIDQRNAGAAVSVSNANVYTLDRWQGDDVGSSGTFSVQRLSATPPNGAPNYLQVKTTTADASITSGEKYRLLHAIEGYNVADLAFGTASAKTITVSFKVRSSLTGTFSGVIQNGALDRSYPFSFAISAANTWEEKIVTISGDTTGTWPIDNTASLVLCFDIGSGSALKGPAGAWAAATYYGVTGAVNLISTLNATLDITQVQVEAGSVATAFEIRPYGTELSLCQRYFQKVGSDSGADPIGSGFVTSSTTAVASVTLLTPMRAIPSLSFSSASNFVFNTAGTANACSSLSLGNASKSRMFVSIGNSGMTTGQGGILRTGSASDGLSFNAEL